MNWFKEVFLPSFGECQSKRISDKQAQIFKQNLRIQPQHILGQCASNYSGEVDGIKITLQDASFRAGKNYLSRCYVTIKKPEIVGIRQKYLN